jgi:hypothetical protein
VQLGAVFALPTQVRIPVVSTTPEAIPVAAAPSVKVPTPPVVSVVRVALVTVNPGPASRAANEFALVLDTVVTAHADDDANVVATAIDDATSKVLNFI